MHAAERIRMQGRVQFTVYDADWRVVRRVRRDNLIVNAWLNRLRDAHRMTTDLTIRELAWGDDNTAVAVTDVALGNELGRKAVTQRTAGATGVVTVVTYISPSEANDTLEEWALFGGDGIASVMVAHVLWNHTKTASESIQVDWVFTFAEVP